MPYNDMPVYKYGTDIAFCNNIVFLLSSNRKSIFINEVAIEIVSPMLELKSWEI